MSLRKNKTPGEQFADLLTEFFGKISFLVVNVCVFIFWILANINLIPGVPAFDPYPFNLLTTFVSLEAIILSIIVLVSQNKVEKIAQVRSEVDFEIDVQSEREITKILKMLDQIQRQLKIDPSADRELAIMEKDLDLARLEQKITDKL
jgi:uncharacterized membrane protein